MIWLISKKALVLLFVICLMSGAVSIHAQVGDPEGGPDPTIMPRRRPATPAGAARRGSTSGEYFPSGDVPIGVGDVIEVSVLGVPDLSKTVEVSSSGNITLPYLGQVHVDGLTVFNLEKKLATLYDADLVNDPQVSVLIREYQSHSITLIGEVGRPGTYPMRSKTSLINALAMAGWINTKAGDKILIHRAGSSPPSAKESTSAGAEVVEINFKDLVKAGNEKLNIELKSGDVVNVTSKDDERFIYLLGGVNRPGAYNTLKNLHLLEATASAGGLSPQAKGDKILIIRMNKEGERLEITTNLDDVIKGKRENILLQENDVVFIPSRGTKNVRDELLNGIITYTPISFLQSLAYSLLR